MGDVAAAVGISAPALYRHFPNKYALFVEAADQLALGLLEVTADVVAEAPGERFDHILEALIAQTIDNRDTGGLYRWEGRHLVGEDRTRARDHFTEIARRVREPLVELHAKAGVSLTPADARVLTAASLSVAASSTAHHTAMPKGQLTTLLLSAARNVAAVHLPPPDPSASPAAAGLDSASKRETIISSALVLFARDGYHDTSVEEISAAVDLTTSGFYRHFESKSQLLAEACQRAGNRLAATASDALREAATPAEGLDLLVHAYARHSFQHHDLMRVYFADIGALAADEQARVRAMQRTHVDEWVALLSGARRDLSPVEARFLVHAGLNIVADVGRLVRFETASLARVTAVVRAALGINYPA